VSLRVRPALSILLISLLALACGPAGTASSARAASAPAASAASGAPGGTINVQAAEYKFDPPAISVAAGSVTFHVTNAGNEEHEFEIFKGETVVDEVEGLVPGVSRDLTVQLEAGDYTFVCKLNNHDVAGMKGTLTVTGS
jgi:iron uptake system component EfeO